MRSRVHTARIAGSHPAEPTNQFERLETTTPLGRASARLLAKALSLSFANERSVALATFSKRAPYQWQALGGTSARKKGHPLQTKTFETRTNAGQTAIQQLVERSHPGGGLFLAVIAICAVSARALARITRPSLGKAARLQPATPAPTRTSMTRPHAGKRDSYRSAQRGPFTATAGTASRAAPPSRPTGGGISLGGRRFRPACLIST